MRFLFLERDGMRLAELISARTFFQRLRGLMFTDELPAGKALMITPCRSVHTFFMRFPIDILFLDRNYRVVEACPTLKPNRLSPIVKEAYHVVELSPGTIDRFKIRPGEQMKISDGRKGADR